jgi:hypothetical protein
MCDLDIDMDTTHEGAVDFTTTDLGGYCTKPQVVPGQSVNQQLSLDLCLHFHMCCIADFHSHWR